MKNITIDRRAYVVLPLPVAVGTVGGQLVALGNGLVGICLTDRATTATIAAGTAAHGLADGEASVALLGISMVANLTLAVAVNQFDKIYVATDGTASKDATGAFVGYALATIGAPGKVDVALKGTPAAAVRQVTIPYADLAAGADIASVVQWAAPASGAILTAIGIVPEGASAGVDNSNTVVIAVTDGAGNSIVSKTYNTATQPPGSGVYGSLGALDATNKVLTANEAVKVAVTQGATADLPAFLLQLEYIVP